MGGFEVRRFTRAGISKAEEMHNPNLTLSLPDFPLEDPLYTEAVQTSGDPITMPEDPDISTREGLVNTVLEAIEGKMELSEVIDDTGLCAWIACKYQTKLRRLGGSSKNHIGGGPAWHTFELSRLIPQSGYKNYYRHCIRGPLALYRSHGGANLDWFMGGPASVRPDVLEQVYSVPHLVTAKEFMKAFNALYHDPDNVYGGGQPDLKGQKTGWVKGAGGKGAGSPRRLVVAYWQFHMTYRIDSMTAEQIISLLPVEFDKFKPDVAE